MIEVANRITIGQSNLSDLVRVHARRHASKAAFIMGSELLTWKAFDLAVDVVAIDVVSRHKGRDGLLGCVGCISSNTTWAYAVMFGIVRAHGVSTFLSNMLSVEVLLRMMDDAALSVLYVGREDVALAMQLALQRPEIQFVVEGEDIEPFSTTAIFGPEELTGPCVDLSAPFSVTYSSGTTGRPKGITHSQLARLWFASDLSRQFDIDSDSICLISTPPYSNGTNLCLLPAMFHGATMILMPKFSVDQLCDIASRHPFSHSFMVPTQYQAIVNSERVKKANWSAIVTLITAGAPMTAELRADVLSIFGQKLTELWGLTEGVGTVLRKDKSILHGGTVGPVGPGADIRLIDTDGKEVLCGEGEIVGRSNMIMEGYLNRPKENDSAQWLSPDGLVYLRTGDIGSFDTNSYLTIRGRIKEMIIRGGFNVYPADIETELCRHPRIIDAAVIGVADDRWGEVPMAFCRLWENVDSSEDDNIQLLSWANSRLSKTQKLLSVEIFPSDFPRNALGKVLKGELRKRYLERSAMSVTNKSQGCAE